MKFFLNGENIAARISQPIFPLCSPVACGGTYPCIRHNHPEGAHPFAQPNAHARVTMLEELDRLQRAMPHAPPMRSWPILTRARALACDNGHKACDQRCVQGPVRQVRTLFLRRACGALIGGRQPFEEHIQNPFRHRFRCAEARPVPLSRPDQRAHQDLRGQRNVQIGAHAAR